MSWKTVAAVVTARPFHQSYPGRVHGGVITALLDETIGRAVNILEPEAWGVTAELKTRYKKPVPYGVPLIVTGRLTANNRRMFTGTGEIILPSGEIAATAEGTYVKMKLSNISDFNASGDDWRVYPSADDPEYIDVPE